MDCIFPEGKRQTNVNKLRGAEKIRYEIFNAVDSVWNDKSVHTFEQFEARLNAGESVLNTNTNEAATNRKDYGTQEKESGLRHQRLTGDSVLATYPSISPPTNRCIRSQDGCMPTVRFCRFPRTKE